MAPRSSVAYADLVNWLAARERHCPAAPVSDDELAAMARVLGLGRRPVAARNTEERSDALQMVPPAHVPPPPQRLVEPDSIAVTVSVPLPPVPFLQPTRIELDDRVDDGDGPDPRVRPLTVAEMVASHGRTPHAPTLAAWSALEPYLRSAMPRRHRGPIDVAALVRQSSTLSVRDRLPRSAPRGWSTHVLVLVDRGSRLLQFRRDQQQLVERLRRCLGRVVVRPIENAYELRPGGSIGRALDDPTTVLVLSDLGIYGDRSHREGWRRLGKMLERRGVDRAALVPAPADRWGGSPVGCWNARVWDQGTAFAVHGGTALASAGSREATEEILDLVSVASRIEPGFLRSVRRLLGQRRANVGVEHDVWSHDEMGARRADATVLSSERADDRRRRFAASTHAQAVVNLLRAWHRPVQLVLWYEEVLAIAAPDRADAAHLLRPGELQAAEEFFRRLGRSVEPGTLKQSELGAIGAWTREFESRVSPETWADPKKRRALTLLWANAYADAPETKPPAGADLEIIERRRGRLRPLEVVQTSDGLHVLPLDEGRVGALTPRSSRSRVATIWLARPQLGIMTPPDEGESYTPLHSDRTGTALARAANAPLVIRTDRTRLTLSSLSRPNWANAIGRDAFGLWVEIWLTRDVRHRLRWISPGRFWMGSPDNEVGRWDDEGPRHLVTISQGFWLGETPCTQGMWDAVMGENPSHFKGEKGEDRRRLPVESVDWDLCSRFVARLGEKLGQPPDGRAYGGEAWRLPREAEWEYACRAGNEEATYGSGWRSDEESHAVLDRIAWYGKNSGSRTHEVCLKEPNAWGLHDMLGNVLEWCDDGKRKYGDLPEHDPIGDTGQGSERVVRGGSWRDVPRYVRAACRDWRDPAGRSPALGFRLARGPSGAQARQAGRPAAAEPL